MLLAWIAVTAAFGYRPWADHVPVQTPPEKAGQEPVRFECGAPLGEDVVVPSPEALRSEYPVARRPCSYRGERRFLVFLNLGLAFAGLLLLAQLTVWSRPARPLPPERLEVGND